MYNKDPKLNFNQGNRYSPHSIILKLINHNKTILDVGCNTGYIGKYFIKNKNCVCDGIDCNQELLNQAKQAGYRNTFKIDLSKSSFKIERKYDAILFIDVLEHLPNPYLILKKIIKENLKDNGKAVICLPNIARLEQRIKHLSGRFDYQKSGIMHQDHLRFFTKKSAIQMLQRTNLQIKKILPTGLGAQIKFWPNLLSFQFIFICRKKQQF